MRRVVRRVLWLACAAPGLALAQGAADPAQAEAEAERAKEVLLRNAPPARASGGGTQSRLMVQDVPIEPPRQMQQTYAKGKNPPGPGDEVRVRHNFDVELRQSVIPEPD